MQKVINRRLNLDGKKYWFTSTSFKSGDKWFNCLYLHFAKDNYPDLDYPKLVDCSFLGKSGKRFDYSSSKLGNIEMHGGCTFYEETNHVESGKTYIKIGCDYQHLYDDSYMMSDHGEHILLHDHKQIAEQFELMISGVNNGTEN